MAVIHEADIRAQLSPSLNEQLSITLFDSLPSTNGYALAHPPLSKPWQVYLAESQTSGRGRLGRTWHSPAYQNIYVSLSWLLDKHYPYRQRLPALSLIVGLGVIEVLRCLAPTIDWQLKWPNDVWGNGLKVAGILLESQNIDGQLHLVVGLGLNVHVQQWPELGKPVTSLALLTHLRFDRAVIVAALLSQWTSDIAVFLATGLEPFRAGWQAADALFGHEVMLNTPQNQIIGTACGIDTNGALQLKHIDGQVTCHSVGEIERLMLKG